MKMNQILLMLFILVLGTTSYGQPSSGCGLCSDPNNNINYTGNGNFTASYAQAYYWEVCNGNATIDGSNTGQTVSVDCIGSYTIKVTRFVNGNCVESCEFRTCSGGGGGSSCPSSNDIFYINEGGGGLCTTGLASISGLSNVNYVNWTWALAGYSGTINNAGTTTPIYYPSGNWTNYYIAICAQVVFNDGTVCDFECKSFLLDCGVGPGNPGPSRSGSLYPNPAKNTFNVKGQEGVDIEEIKIINAQGAIVKTIKSNFNDEIDISDQKNGIYFISLKFDDGTSEIKKLVVEK